MQLLLKIIKKVDIFLRTIAFTEKLLDEKYIALLNVIKDT